MDEKIKNRLCELLQVCQLPELQQDLDNVFINETSFVEFHNVLRLHLPLLYEVVQQNINCIFTAEGQEYKEVFTNLVAVLCEITAPEAVYSLPDEHLLKAAENLLERITLSDEIVEQLFANYQRKLQKETWKKQLGGIHGFLQFLRKIFATNIKRMSICEMNFCLSVALNVRECYDNIYKQMGIQIFSIILRNTAATDIKSINIHEVIYESVFKDVSYMDSLYDTHAIWHCLMQTLDFCNIDSTSWSRADDMLEALMRNIPLAPNGEISFCMFKFVTKLGYYFSSNSEEISQCSENMNNLENINAMMAACDKNNSHLIYRWAKCLLKLLVIEAYKLKQNSQLCCKMLQEIHCSFLVYIWPLPLPIIAPDLRKFYEKYIMLLREVFLTYKSDSSVLELLRNFIQTCMLKFTTSIHESKKEDYADVITAFEVLFHPETQTKFFM